MAGTYSLHLMLVSLEVKGEAMEASPRRTKAGSRKFSSLFLMKSCNIFYQRSLKPKPRMSISPYISG